MIDLPSPRKVGDVNHTIDTLFEADECTISGEVAHLSLDFLADRVTSLDLGPWILLELANPKRDLLLFGRNPKNNRLDLLIKLKHIARSRNTLDPRKLGNVNKPLNPFLNFDKGTVRKKFSDLPGNFSSNWEAGFNISPWVVSHLLETKRDALLVTINIEDLNLDFLAYAKHFRWVRNAPPTHIGDMEKSIHTLKVDESAEVRDIFNLTDNLISHDNGLKEFLAKLSALGLNDLTAT